MFFLFCAKVSERLKVRVSLAKLGLLELANKGVIRPVSVHRMNWVCLSCM